MRTRDHVLSKNVSTFYIFDKADSMEKNESRFDGLWIIKGFFSRFSQSNNCGLAYMKVVVGVGAVVLYV